MSNSAMSNETDLDWLARVLHKWPDGDGITMLGRGCSFFDTGVGRSVHVYAVDGSDYTTIKEKDWLARRAELQNKPGWDHEAVPAWATALAQDQDGEWKWLGDNVTQYVDGFTADKIRAQHKGVVLGSWRDTLEKRPEQAEFEPFVSVEDNQEQDMKQDNKWFERGELPPAGVECDIRHSCWNSEKYEKVTVAAITNEYLIVKYATFEQHYMLKDISFRPIRTERDVLLSVIVEEMNRYDTDGKLADAILAAGFSLRDK